MYDLEIITNCCRFVGPTERDILANPDETVDYFLPIEKMKTTYSDLNSAKNMILNHITCHSRVDVMPK